jgi:hypothetical protein
MDHSITPPPDKHKQWEDDILFERENVDVTLDCAWRDGFRAGADQELEACIEWVTEILELPVSATVLRTTRRPKPPSLKEQALLALEDGDTGPGASLTPVEVCIIRRTLEALPND